MNGKKIIVVGGGTASWISAIMFHEVDPSLKITIIHSEEIKTIGVGESTTPMFYNFINKWVSCIDEKDFLIKTGATIKLGVVHQGWKDGTDIFFNPIDSVDHFQSPAHPYDFDSLRSYCVVEGIPLDINYESLAIKNALVPFEKVEGKLVKRANYAYHLDVNKTIEYLRNVCIKLGIEVIEDTVEQPVVNYTVQKLKLKSGVEVEGDFFVDCSGQRGVLSNLFENKWKPISASILDTAVLYEEASSRTRTHTLAKATTDGWEWKIPHNGKRKCGYMFNSSITCSSCVQEQLQSDRLIKFKSGRLEKFLNKNILSLGLSSGFVEPLEATSLHLTLVQLKVFLDKYFRSDINYPNFYYEEQYNFHIKKLWDSTFDWIRMHYINARQDSKFWIENSKTSISTELESLLNIYKSRMPRYTDFSSKQIYQTALVYHVLDGMKILDRDTAQKELQYYGLYNMGKKQYEKLNKENNELITKFVTNDYLLANIFDIY